jgi:hypothetical protein
VARHPAHTLCDIVYTARGGPLHRVEDIMAPLRFVEGLARPSWHLPGTTPTKCAGRRAVTRHRVGWAVIAVALGLLQGDAARAGALTDAKLTLHIWELPAVEFPATVATGVSVSDTEFHVASVTWFYGGSTTVENTAPRRSTRVGFICAYTAPRREPSRARRARLSQETCGSTGIGARGSRRSSSRR